MSADELWFEEPDNELDDDESASQDDNDWTPTVPCPQCGAEVYEDAVRCPACGSYITHDTRVWSGRSGWWILLGLLGIVAAILALAGLIRW